MHTIKYTCGRKSQYDKVLAEIITATQQGCQPSFNARKTPTKWTVRILVAKFWEGGSFADARRQVRPPMASSAENIQLL